MTNQWEPGVQYNLGDSVLYNGSKYNIIQAHRSQSDWTPDVTPALWGKVPGGGGNDHQSGGGYGQQQQGYQQQQQQPQGYGQQQQGYGQQHTSSNNSGDYGQEKKDESFGDKVGDFFHDHKKELEIGGGIAAGAALLGAAGLAYKHHQDKKHEQEEQNKY